MGATPGLRRALCVRWRGRSYRGLRGVLAQDHRELELRHLGGLDVDRQAQLEEEVKESLELPHVVVVARAIGGDLVRPGGHLLLRDAVDDPRDVLVVFAPRDLRALLMVAQQVLERRARTAAVECVARVGQRQEEDAARPQDARKFSSASIGSSTCSSMWFAIT